MNQEYQQKDLNKQHKELIRYGKVIKDIQEKYTRETIFNYNNSEYLVKMELGEVKLVKLLKELSKCKLN